MASKAGQNFLSGNKHGAACGQVHACTSPTPAMVVPSGWPWALTMEAAAGLHIA